MKKPFEAGTRISRYRDFRKSRPEAVGMLIEGDSWFDYPQVLSTNIPTELKNLLEDKIVQLDKSGNGDDAREMLCGEQYDALYDIVAQQKLAFDCILISGGGNDIVGANLPVLLNPYKPGYSWENCLNMIRFQRRLLEVEYAYLDLADLRDDYQPGAYIFTQGYDYALPSGKGLRIFGLEVAGKWIKARMDAKDIPEEFQGTILEYMLAEFDNMLIRLEQTIPRCVHVRTQGTLKDSDWANELHPTTVGFKKIAAKYQAALAGVFPSLATPR
jgi:hypothetical protein